MFFPELLLQFVRAHRDELTLSVHVEAAPTDPAARRDWRVRIRHGLQSVRDSLASAPPDEQDAFERCASEVFARLSLGASSPSLGGWACFSAASGETVDVPLPILDWTETGVTWGIGARIVPSLARSAEPSAS